MSVVALIPARNEELRIAETVAAVRMIPDVDRVLVIENGSTDRTAQLAREAGAEVLSSTEAGGKGGALQVGLDAVRDVADAILLIDADVGETAREAGALLAPLLAGDADMTVARLPRPPRSGGFGLVKGLARWGIRRFGSREFESAAPLSGQRGLTRVAWEAATPFAHGWGAEVALTIRTLRAGLRVAEVPLEMAHAHTGRDASGFMHRGRQLFGVASALASIAFERRERHV